jgi:hypothetical protein
MKEPFDNNIETIAIEKLKEKTTIVLPPHLYLNLLQVHLIHQVLQLLKKVPQKSVILFYSLLHGLRRQKVELKQHTLTVEMVMISLLNGLNQ